MSSSRFQPHLSAFICLSPLHSSLSPVFWEKKLFLHLSLSLSHTHTQLLMGIFSLITGRPGPSGFGSASTAEQVTEGVDASNLTAIVTGQLCLPFPWALFSSHKVHDLLDCLVNVVRVIIWSLSWDFLRTCFSWLSIHCLSVLFWFLFRLFLFLGFCSSFCAGFHGLLACSDSAMLLKKVTTTSSETPWKQSKQKHLPFFFCLHFLPLFSNYPNRNSAILEFFPDSKRHWKWKLIL